MSVSTGDPLRPAVPRWRSPSPTVHDEPLPVLPCHIGDPDLWFSEDPGELQFAKVLCGQCPVRAQCLAAALERAEPWGVWGGEIFDQGSVVGSKRARGRPRKGTAAA